MASMFAHAALHGPADTERVRGEPADKTDEHAGAAESLRHGFFMATMTALAFWGVVALMILFVLV